jgi:hypothetical protein
MKTNTLIVLSALFTVITPAVPLILVSLMAIFVDACFGIWRSVKKNGWVSFQSKKLIATVQKSFLYSGAILFFYMIEKYIAGDIIAHFISVELLITKAVAFFCVFTEVKSINENYKDVTGVDILTKFKAFMTGLKKESDKWK